MLSVPTVTSPRAISLGRGLVIGLVLAMAAACAPKEDVTPPIVVSPGVKERIMVMDRFRHHGSPRRLLPRVTVEEVDESELPPATDANGNANGNANDNEAEGGIPHANELETTEGDAGPPASAASPRPAPGVDVQ